ncbi:Non-specific lipid-transfer protein-like protein [Drosera capensis]
MANSGLLTRLASVLIICVMVALPQAEAAIACNKVVESLLPCIGYLRAGGAVSGSCCNGVRYIVTLPTAEKRIACACAKQIIISFGVNLGYANSLPGKCGASFGYTISLNLDCSSHRRHPRTPTSSNSDHRVSTQNPSRGTQNPSTSSSAHFVTEPSTPLNHRRLDNKRPPLLAAVHSLPPLEDGTMKMGTKTILIRVIEDREI